MRKIRKLNEGELNPKVLDLLRKDVVKYLQDPKGNFQKEGTRVGASLKQTLEFAKRDANLSPSSKAFEEFMKGLKESL